MRTWVTRIALLGVLIAAAALGACGRSDTSPEASNKITYVIETEALDPAEQQKQFTLPDGFKIELFAAEPDITKPMNVAFDARGRMWVTQSSEYPIAAPLGEGSDKITILEDTDGDGRADKFTDFADNLNIPIGILPVHGGVIVYSIPNVYFLPDRDGDDRADGERVLLSGFGYEDTHGMVNSFVRGYDGLVYASHGFTNTSDVRGTDGSSINLVSGSTFRFRMDGSDVERTTTGRVNPFGSALDRNGYLYSVDCHSSPIYQLIHGGEYPSFGRPHSGLGFAPVMMRHTHGPTAIAGLVVYEAEQFPKEYRGNAFVGNVVSNSIKRDAITFRGSTPEAQPRPDFLTSKDPWFRPVDLELGPDGAIYVADFYNAIIGHYEVPLDHPRRDRTRGRIWRITYVGEGATPAPGPGARDLTKATEAELIEALADPNLVVRMMATDQLSDRIGASAAPALQAELTDLEGSGDLWAQERRRVHAMWALHRMGQLSDEALIKLLGDGFWTMRLHATNALAERARLSPALAAQLKLQVTDADPRIRRAAMVAMGRHPETGDIPAILDQLGKISPHDTHLLHVARLSLRDQLTTPAVAARVLQADWTAQQSRDLAAIFIAVPTQASGEFVWRHLQRHEEPPEVVVRLAAHAGRYGPPRLAGEIADFARARFPDAPHQQFALYNALHDGFAANGRSLPRAVDDWGLSAASAMLAGLPEATEAAWRHGPLKELYPTLANSWTIRNAPGASGAAAERALFAEEWSVGAAQSPVFAAPESLSFTLYGAGGVGVSDVATAPSMVQLRAAEDDAVLMTAKLLDQPATAVRWNLAAHQGKRVYLEIVDGAPDDTAPEKAFQAIGIGGLSPAVVALPVAAPPEVAALVTRAADIAAANRATALAPALSSLIGRGWLDQEARLAAARAVATIDPVRYAGALTQSFVALAQDDPLREGLAGVLGRSGQEVALDALIQALPSEGVYKTQLTQALAATAGGRARLLAAAEAQRISPRLLQERTVAGQFERFGAAEQKRALERLFAALPPADEARQQLIAQRVSSFVEWDADLERGKAVFADNCAACHAINGVGGEIGPQLDGIGRWGAERLIHKILDPNSAVNEGFRTWDMTFKDGSFQTAMIRREEGQTLVLADASGAEFTAAKADVVSREPSELSLMPDGFGDMIPEEDFTNLIAYLLAQQ